MNPIPDTLHDWHPAPELLHERVILITGAANGIGRALAGACAAHGASVILLDRDVRALEQAYDEIMAAGQPEPALYPMDLKGATPDDYATLAETVKKEFGRLDGLVHNAAYLGALVPFANFEHELWFDTLQINLNAPYLLTLACLDLLQQSRDASIVFTADATGRHGKAYWGAYAVSKAGTEGFMQILADELEANTPIRVNSLDPGPVRTGLRLIAYPYEDRDALPCPADVLKPFLFLLGPDSKGITGQQLSVTDLV
jgi:NAD(P)-dependent dehydrogenase (short-subunit alcohol dehydrogenase family)